MQYVGFWRRFAAIFIDGIVVWVLQIPVNLIFAGAAAPSINDPYNATAAAGIGLGSMVASIAVSVLYWVVFQGKYGQTLGKKALGIKVVDVNGKTPSMMTFFLREIIGKFVSGIILLIGYLMVIWDGKKQGLHDKIAGTFVVRVGSTQSSSAQTTEPAKA